MNIFDLGGLTRAVVAALVALIPAIVAYVRGRQLARYINDPALPERLFAPNNVTIGSIAFTVALLIMTTGGAAIWAIPLMLIAYCAAGLPLRRVLYQETWSLPRYLAVVIRFFIAFWSFWLLVCALPALALWAGERAWLVALILGLGLLLLGSRQLEVIRWLIGARPLLDEPARTRFDRLVSIARLPAPRLEVLDLSGGSIANAFAMPSRGGGTVVFTRPLLEQLDADEADAICAHELAHLEYHNPRRIAQRHLVSRALVVAGALLAPVAQYLTPSYAWILGAAWPAGVLIVLAILAQEQQQHESASDLRAIALTGNPEALVRALVKIHALSRMPRRLDADLERHMSHPSLRRRIQDIRAAAGTAPAALGGTASFVSADGTARAIFDVDHLEWIDGASASYRLAYDRLGDLRIAATRAGETSLVAADRAGHRWKMEVRAEDVPRLQAVLDIVDTRVRPGAPAAAVQPLLIFAATTVAVVASLSVGQLAVGIVLALTFGSAAAPVLSAAGLAAIAGAILAWRDPAPAYALFISRSESILPVALLASGGLLVWLAYSRRNEEVPPRAWQLVGVLAVAASASWILPIATNGLDAVGLHLAARGQSSSVVLPLALAGATMWSIRTTLRAASAAAILAGVVAVGVGSQAFLDRFGDDPLLLPAPNVKVRILDRPIKEFRVPFGVSQLLLSPGGASIGVQTYRQDSRSTVRIGRAGEAGVELDVDGALFIDDDRVLAWTSDGTRINLREVLVDTPASPTWDLTLTAPASAKVSLEPKTKRWRVSGRAGVDALESQEGVVGTPRVDSFRWSAPADRGSQFMPIAHTGDRTLAVEPRGDVTPLLSEPLGALAFVFANGLRWPTTFWALGPDGPRDLGTTRLETACQPMALDDRGACHVFDGSRTRFFAVEAGSGTITGVASLPGRMFVGGDPQYAWVIGWHDGDPIAVRIAPADAIRIEGPNGTRAHMLAVGDRVAAGVFYQMPPTSGTSVAPMNADAGTSIVRIYPID